MNTYFKFLCSWVLVLATFHKFSSLLFEADNISNASSVAYSPPFLYLSKDTLLNFPSFLFFFPFFLSVLPKEP